MAAKSAAQQWLLAHQRAAYQKLKLTPAHAADVVAQARVAVEGASSIVLDPNTGFFEDPFFFTIIRDRAADIEEIIELLDLPLPKPPVLGTLPTGKVYAEVFRITYDGETVIVFDRGLFVFTLLLVKVLAQATPRISHEDGTVSVSYNNEAVVNNLSSHPEIVEAFIDLLRVYAVLADIRTAERYRLSNEFNTMLNVYIRSVELFALGHEYAHITLGHLNKPGQTGHKLTHVANGHALTAEEIIYAYQQELEADAWGLKFSRTALSKHGIDLANAVLGPTIFFCALELNERLISLLETGNESLRPAHATHPPPEQRLLTMRDGIYHSLGATAEGPLDLSNKVEWIFNLLWQRAHEYFFSLHIAGIRAHPVWRKNLIV